MPKRAVVYVRISRDKEGAGLGVDRQRQDCEALAQRHDLQIVRTYSDNDLSAYSGKRRPEYLAMLEALRSGQADAVIAWHTDRLHRSLSELEEYIAICEPRGIPTLTVTAGPLDLSSPSGRMVARQLGVVARYEVDHMRERQQRARQQAVTEGRWLGGQRPYGYEADGVTVRPQEAAHVLWASEGILAGRTLRGLAAELNLKGARTSTGAQWQGQTLRRMLMRVRNAGLVEHNGVVVGPALWPAIVPEGTWRALVALLSEPDRRHAPPDRRRYRGSGLYLCGTCGEPLLTVSMTITNKNGPATYKRAYACGVSRHVIRRQQELDDWVDRAVVKRLLKPDARDLIELTGGDDTAALSAQLVAIRQRQDQAAGAFATGDIDLRQMTLISTRLRSEIEQLEQQLAAAASGSALAGLADAEDPEAAWLAAPVDHQRAALAALLTVVVHPSLRERPKGWKVGNPYFDRSSIEFRWRA